MSIEGQSNPWWRLLKILGVSYAGYRVLQAITDEKFEGRVVPADVRREMIKEADRRCNHCGRRFPESKLNIDHIVPHSAGGLTSRANSQVLCTHCNAEKGSSYGLIEWLKGRKR